MTLAVAVGDNCIDTYLPPIERKFSGGNALNVAVYLQRAGCPSAYVGAVGNDENGEKIIRDVARENVDVSHVKTYLGYTTAYTHIRLSENKERQFVFEDFGPKDVFKLDESDLDFILKHRLVHNSWQGGTEQYLPRFKQEPDVIVSQDYGERYSPDFVDQTIPFVDIAFFSLPEESEMKMIDIAEKMKARGPRLVVVTQGLNGSLAFDGNPHFQKAYPAQVVDTLGAGDAFIGTFLANWINKKDIADCMENAARTASQTCSHFGGW